MTPIATLVKLKNRRLNKKRRTLKIGGADRTAEVRYRRRLQAFVRSLINETANKLIPLLKTLEKQYTDSAILENDIIFNDAYAGDLNRVIRRMANNSRNLGAAVERVAEEWADDVSQKDKKRLHRSIKRAIGVDVQSIASEKGVRDILDAKISENVSLIQSLPDEYYKKINVIVNEMTSKKQPAKSIIKELRKVGISTDKRAKLIARDQTQKLNSVLTRTRQENLGINEYEWQTSDDERVRETHKRNNGKVFKWSDPPKETGHPGDDIQCRCNALPIINLD
jgi:SPP1 gp7 family putative phage head morphogenesis protein